MQGKPCRSAMISMGKSEAQRLPGADQIGEDEDGNQRNAGKAGFGDTNTERSNDDEQPGGGSIRCEYGHAGLCSVYANIFKDSSLEFVSYTLEHPRNGR